VEFLSFFPVLFDRKSHYELAIEFGVKFCHSGRFDLSVPSKSLHSFFVCV